MKNRKLYFLFSMWFILSLAVASTGCIRHGILAPPDQHYSSTSKNLRTIRTVCLVELYNNSAYPQISGDVTESLHQALQKKNISSAYRCFDKATSSGEICKYVLTRPIRLNNCWQRVKCSELMLC